MLTLEETGYIGILCSFCKFSVNLKIFKWEAKKYIYLENKHKTTTSEIRKKNEILFLFEEVYTFYGTC